MVGQSDWLPMTMATGGFVSMRAPLGGSGDDVWQQDVLELHDPVLQRELPLL